MTPMIPPFFWQLCVNAILLGGLYALIAMGLNLQYGLTRILNVAYGDFMILSGYVTFWLFVLYGVIPPISIVVNFLLMVVIGLILYRFAFRRLFEVHKTSERLEGSSVLVAFGLSYIIQNIIVAIWGGQLRSYTYLSGTIEMFGSIIIPLDKLLIFVIALITSLSCYSFLKYHIIGKAMRATKSQPHGAATLGIDIFKMHGFSFCWGLGMAGVAGTLASVIYLLNPSAGLPFTYAGFIMVVLGGLGNLLGSTIAAFIIASVQIFVGYFWSVGIAELVVFSVLLIVLIWKPTGLLGGR
ncbi:MAG: branched-chain amino acid ABC transporter permease [Candidatus Bathyarchaeia archaeon]